MEEIVAKVDEILLRYCNEKTTCEFKGHFYYGMSKDDNEFVVWIESQEFIDNGFLVERAETGKWGARFKFEGLISFWDDIRLDNVLPFKQARDDDDEIESHYQKQLLAGVLSLPGTLTKDAVFFMILDNITVFLE